jgi:hypothetical protein
MALVVKDRVKETTTTTGTGTVTLAGAATGYQSFSAIGNANTTYYCIAGQGTSEWEVGVGTYTSSGTTLSRDTVLASSNSGSAVNFSAGTKDVFVTFPASIALQQGTYALYTSGTSTWTAPAGVTAVKVVCIGGGGGGSSWFSTPGGNGGLAIGSYTVTPGTGYTVTVGAGGAGSNGGNGSSGGTSSFGSLISATGGGGATGVDGTPGAGSSGIFFNGTNQSALDGIVAPAYMLPVASTSGKNTGTTSAVTWAVGQTYGGPGAFGNYTGLVGYGAVGGAVLIEYVG